eukprot:TRINITY_DN4958_c0_g1_i2.p1 TRINITY_DN4958_c0_g1~~TRINITY_DN4958_c0_g1_i2.p1  ORF type:complete len:116 (+),score=13.60 TRINITY_DN4958_c0_g1_i2:72-419(+)
MCIRDSFNACGYQIAFIRKQANKPDRLMERRVCRLHCNKPLESFCWTCQSLICSCCEQDHSAFKHRTYLLWRINLPKVRKKAQQKPVDPIPPQDTSNAPPPVSYTHLTLPTTPYV